MITRDLRREDVGDFVECLKACFTEEFEVEGFDEDVVRKIFRRRFGVFGSMLFGFLGLLGKEPIKLFVADVDGKLVGTTFVSKHREIGLLSTVMVHPDFRRKEIATELMKVAISYVRKRKLARAVLQVSSINNPAKSLYHKLGFKKFDETVYLTINIDSLPSLGRSTEIQVRGFKKSDIDDVHELIKSMRDPSWLKVHGFKKSDLKTSLWDRMSRMSTAKKIVATKGEKIVGYASFSYATSKVTGRISTLEASPDMVLKGVEEELIKTSIDYIKSSGTKMLLVTLPQTRQQLIERLIALGFKQQAVMESMVLE